MADNSDNDNYGGYTQGGDKKKQDIQDEKQSKVTVTLMSCKVKSVEKRKLHFPPQHRTNLTHSRQTDQREGRVDVRGRSRVQGLLQTPHQAPHHQLQEITMR